MVEKVNNLSSVENANLFDHRNIKVNVFCNKYNNWSVTRGNIITIFYLFLFIDYVITRSRYFVLRKAFAEILDPLKLGEFVLNLYCLDGIPPAI